MPENIEPWQIAVAAVVIIVGVLWFMMRKNSATDTQARERIERLRQGVTDPLAKKDALTHLSAKSNVLQEDEPDVPVLSAEDQQVEVADTEPVAPKQMQVPTPNIDPDIDFGPIVVAGRNAPNVDRLVEAVVYFTPRTPAFEPHNLLGISKILAESELRDRLKVDFFDAETNAWYSDINRLQRCTQICLSILLADRTWSINELTAGQFIAVADRLAMDLDGEASIPDASDMLESTQRVQQLIQKFDCFLKIRLVASKALDNEEIERVAREMGFVKQDASYVKMPSGGKTPTFYLTPSTTVRNELDFAFDVPLLPAVSDPLTTFFALANDLCCKFGAEMLDASGNAITTQSAALIAHQLRDMHRTMAESGVSAGSARALRIFGR